MNNDMIIVELDKPRELRMSNKTVKKLEKMFKMTIQHLSQKVAELTTEEFEKLLYECLKYGPEDTILSLEQWIDLLDEHTNYGELLMLTMELFSATFGKEEEIKERMEKISGKKANPNV